MSTHRTLALVHLSTLLALSGCATELPSAARGTLTSDSLPIRAGEHAWAAEMTTAEGPVAYLVTLDPASGRFASGTFDPSTGELTVELEARAMASEGGYLVSVAGRLLRVEDASSRLLLDGELTALEAMPAPGGPPARLPLAATGAQPIPGDDVGATQAAVIPRSIWGPTCCIDCYNAHRTLGIPRSFDAYCCQGTCESWEFPCDPATSPDGCECDDEEQSAGDDIGESTSLVQGCGQPPNRF